MQRYEIFLAPPNTIASNFYEISRLDYVDYVKRICTHADSKCPLNSYLSTTTIGENPETTPGNYIQQGFAANQSCERITREQNPEKNK